MAERNRSSPSQQTRSQQLPGRQEVKTLPSNPKRARKFLRSLVNAVGRPWLVLPECLTFLTDISFLDLRSLPADEFHSRTGTFPHDNV